MNPRSNNCTNTSTSNNKTSFKRMTSQLSSDQINVTLKWNKQVFSTVVYLGENWSSFKKRVEDITGVPMARQKLLAKQQRGCWKGPLKDDIILTSEFLFGLGEDVSSNSSEQKKLVVTLIGSAEALVEAPTTQRITFIEDLSPQELQAEEDAQLQAAMATAEGMIPALQYPPHQRDDNKQEQYQYNRLVYGLPQRQIEQELKYGQGANKGELQGKVAMNLGLELRRAYVNDVAVLHDGTCVSVLDDGHVQLWKHGTQQKDSVHAPGADGGVTSIAALRQRGDSAAAFATVGRGALYLWSMEGDPVLAVPAGMPGATTPDSLVSIYGGMKMERANKDDETITCLATRFHVTRLQNPSQFRLVPQNDEERRRRAQAEAQEQAVQQALTRASHSVQIWYSIQGSTLRTKMLELTNEQAGSAIITCLEVLSYPNGQRFLVAGDTEGRMWVWKAQPSRDGQDIEFEFQTSYQIRSSGGSKCAIVCLCALRNGRLAVSSDHSTSPITEGSSSGEGVIILVDTPRSAIVLDVANIETPRMTAVLGGHERDAVICMCQLPNGDLLTGGGKNDATLQMWCRQQIYNGEGREEHILLESKKKLTDVGYVFALTVLHDSKVDSSYYAIAAARYNTVKLVI